MARITLDVKVDVGPMRVALERLTEAAKKLTREASQIVESLVLDCDGDLQFGMSEISQQQGTDAFVCEPTRQLLDIVEAAERGDLEALRAIQAARLIGENTA